MLHGSSLGNTLAIFTLVFRSSEPRSCSACCRGIRSCHVAEKTLMQLSVGTFDLSQFGSEECLNLRMVRGVGQSETCVIIVGTSEFAGRKYAIVVGTPTRRGLMLKSLGHQTAWTAVD